MTDRVLSLLDQSPEGSTPAGELTLPVPDGWPA